MKNELEIMWKEAIVAKIRYYPNNCLQELKKTIETSVIKHRIEDTLLNKHIS
jgi:hypothetical protein